MKRQHNIELISLKRGLCVGLLAVAAAWVDAAERRLPLSVYRDKMVGGWLGQMAGVGWGAPTEFKHVAAMIPDAAMPPWKADMINQHGNDDLYVEMTFLKTLEDHGLDVSIRQAGIDWANSGYKLWHANEAGRGNLRRGIAPPDSGHPRFNAHADDIDYQIEADFAGLIAPGLPNQALALGEVFGRLMNYGDGLYGGQFVAGMYTEAFFEADPVKLVEFGLRCIPAASQYAEGVRDVLAWYREQPADWRVTWHKVEAKYQDNPAYRRFSCGKGAFNIDAKINGAYIVMGLLYGGGDPDRTIAIACRCGQDSDCNPSNAAGILFTSLGAARVPPRLLGRLDLAARFSHTGYDLPKVYAVCEQLARAAVQRAGGGVERGADGAETFVIPMQAPRPGPCESCWEPRPVANARFSDEERARIRAPAERVPRCAPVDLSSAVNGFAPGWRVRDCGSDMSPGIVADWRGRETVLVTHPLSATNACVLFRQVSVPVDRTTTLRALVSHYPAGDWLLVVRADGKELHRQVVGKETAPDGWLTVNVDLTPLAGQTVALEVLNQPNGWSWEAGYWGKLAVENE